MERLFLKILGMSITGAAVIVMVLLARLVLKKAPKIFSYVLWAVVLFRLLCPVSIHSPLSMVFPVQVESNRESAGIVEVTTGTSVMVISVNGPLEGEAVQPAPGLPDSAENGTGIAAPEQKAAPGVFYTASMIWLAGAALLLGYSALSLLRLRRGLVGFVPLEGEENVRLADHIPSPFVLGVFRPKIYLPSGLPEDERDYILLHERTHIRRGDHIFRALAWLAVAVHWFNPLVWLAFSLAGKDMEMSCDEAVLRKMGRDIRADYSTSLLRLSQGGKLPAGPLAFGGGSPQSRIKNILRYQKPALWAVAAALAVVLCAGAALATDPGSARRIDPGSVLSVTAFDAASYTVTPQGTGVYTEADRQKDLADPADAYVLSDEDGAELVRLINQYEKSVYARGELDDLSGWEHHLKRIDCVGGDFYLLDFWYWNGFSFNPLYFGEDDYTTLVTHYDAEGSAGETWQMEYGFDVAYRDWWHPVARAKEEAVGEDLTADLTFTLDTEGEERGVRIEGAVGDVELIRGAHWSPPHLFPEYPRGWLSMVYPAFAEEMGGHITAGWTDESRASVLVSTSMSAMLSSVYNVGWWDFTVDLGSGRVTNMEGRSFREGKPDGETRFYPESISEEEAVKAARVTAKLLTAAEDYYSNAVQDAPQG